MNPFLISFLYVLRYVKFKWISFDKLCISCRIGESVTRQACQDIVEERCKIGNETGQARESCFGKLIINT